LFDQVSKARESARDLQCQSCLNQIAFALYCYHDTYEAFPPAVVADERGTPLYSWRVLLLPWLGFTELYDEFDLNASWDSPQNMRLAARTPPYFRCPSGLSAGDVQFTNYVVISGPGTAFPGTQSTSVSDFRDGVERTILLVEIANSTIHRTWDCVGEQYFCIPVPTRHVASGAQKSDDDCGWRASGVRATTPEESLVGALESGRKGELRCEPVGNQRKGEIQ
jgi:hypothetical protein